MKPLALATCVSALALFGCNEQNQTAASQNQAAAQANAQASAPNAEQAAAFLKKANDELAQSLEDYGRASWIAATYINFDSQYLEAKAATEFSLLSVKLAKEAAKYDQVQLDASSRRQMNALKKTLSFPAPNDPAQAKRLAEIGSKMQGMYGKGKYCNDERCYNLGEMSAVFANSRDPELLKELWAGWRQVSPPMRPLYEEQVSIANKGAKDLGFENLSVLWRSKYDMDPDAFAADADAQWQKVKPLYDSLQCHVRAKLNEHYGDDVAPATGKIPAHLLGNMWAQTWGNVYDLVKPEGVEQSYNLTQLIEKSGMSEMDMVKTGEAFFSSLGFKELPETFWERSQLTKPQDRDVVCHASAWDIDNIEDLRIKMCIQKNGEDFQTIHHELGHNYYQRAYNQQPMLFRESANDGFHEALGDVVGLSITPSYLVQIGLLDKEPPASEDLGFLMQQALDKIAFLPFGLLVDKWRWQVFNGDLQPADYNKGWWELREKYQGITPPLARSEANFDPGAKYHVPGNTPYTRYFLAFIQQFQFHRALCEKAGYQGPLHRCSIYNNKEVGESLKTMMAMGSSRPWQDAMEAVTGQRELDASAIIDYFAPLKVWLDEQNKGRQCGW
ncbi:MAG: M2 family metallopeptidase [Cellvibrionaceae bacterium]|nr:M2 family metallopeptidase [Cellvibrionaceae bacterium]